MATSQTPITPIRQAMVNIAGHNILGVLLEGGRVAASLRMICDLLGVDYMGQMRKIRANRAIYDSLILALVETTGGPQETNVIIAEAIPMWLAGIHESRVSPAARETLIAFQRVAVQTLRAFFFPEAKTQQQSTPPPKPEAHPLPPPDVSSMSVFDMLRAVINRVEQEHQEMGAWKAQIDRAVINPMGQDHREMEAWKAQIDRQRDEETAWKAEMQHQMQLQRETTEVLWSVVLGNASAPEGALSTDQQQALQLLLHHQHKLTGQPRAALEHELLMLVGVAEFHHLQQGDWKKLMAWFRQRLGW